MESSAHENWALWVTGDLEETLQKETFHKFFCSFSFFLLFLVENPSQMADFNDDLV